MKVTLPIRTVSEANQREHWAKKAKRAASQRGAATLVVKGHGLPPLPVIVTLVRIAPRELDSDGLVISFKAIRDGVADAYRLNDRDPRIGWQYWQRRGKPKEYAVEIEIQTMKGE